MVFPFTVVTESADQTEEIGAALAKTLQADASLPRFVALYGDLGVGKTAFVRGFTAEIAPHVGVRSPTFTLVNEYRGGVCPIFHFDMYRITSEEDLYSIGFDDYQEQNAYCLAEWCENIPFAIPAARVCVLIEKTDSAHPLQRRISVTCHTHSAKGGDISC